MLGLFDDGPQAPRLADMLTAALARLSRNRRGFLLVVEGARIDWMSHDNDPAGTLLAVRELDQAVAAALDFARRRGRTLVVVTSDHETGGLTVAEGSRLNALASFAEPASAVAARVAADRANVREALAAGAGITDLTAAEVGEMTNAPNLEAAVASLLSRRAGLTWATTGHTATQVRVFAFGIGAHRFAGQLDNTDIAKRMAAVLGLGTLND